MLRLSAERLEMTSMTFVSGPNGPQNTNIQPGQTMMTEIGRSVDAPQPQQVPVNPIKPQTTPLPLPIVIQKTIGGYVFRKEYTGSDLFEAARNLADDLWLAGSIVTLPHDSGSALMKYLKDISNNQFHDAQWVSGKNWAEALYRGVEQKYVIYEQNQAGERGIRVTAPSSDGSVVRQQMFVIDDMALPLFAYAVAKQNFEDKFGPWEVYKEPKKLAVPDSIKSIHSNIADLSVVEPSKVDEPIESINDRMAKLEFNLARLEEIIVKAIAR